jgi:hypothetical protein
MHKDEVKFGKSSNNFRSAQGSPIGSPKLLKMETDEIKKQIKKVLVTSIRLKMKLQKQNEYLRHKSIIDEKVILEHLNLPFKNKL